MTMNHAHFEDQLMSDTLTGDDRRNYIVEILGAKYPDRMCRSDIKCIVPDNWTDNNLDTALHVLKKRCIVSKTFDGYQLVTAPASYNQKLIAEANAGGATAPEPVKGVSSMDTKPLRSMAQHKADKKSIQVAPPKLCSHHHCTTGVPAGVEYCAACKATLSCTPLTDCEHGEPFGCCAHPLCVKDFVRPKPVAKGSEQAKPSDPKPSETNYHAAVSKAIPAGQSPIRKAAAAQSENDTVKCDECGFHRLALLDACPCSLCPTNAHLYDAAEQTTTQEDAKFCRADIDAALKDLEKQLAKRPPVEDLELKLDLLADFERMFDARLKPILAAIAKDLQQ
jgi:hypothetical protein